MKFTNVHNLIPPVEAMLRKDEYASAADISATSLIDSPRIFQLNKRHKDQISEDVSQRLWSTVGTLVHKALEEAVHDSKGLSQGYIPEKRWFVKMLGKTLSGSTDLYVVHDSLLIDYKVVNVNSVIRQQEKWEQQLNIYAYLHRVNKVEVKKLQNVVIVKGWNKFSINKPGYPKTEIATIEQPLWTKEAQEEYITKRMKLHIAASECNDFNLPECTAHERWAIPYAVSRVGDEGGRALKCCKTRLEAEADIKDRKIPGEYIVTERSKEGMRCGRYCTAAPFCNQYQRDQAE